MVTGYTTNNLETGTGNVQKLKMTYRELIQMKDNNQRMYESLYRYYRSLYSRVFEPDMIVKILNTDVGSYILNKYLKMNYKNVVEVTLDTLVNVSDYEELTSGELKFKNSDSRFVRYSEYRDLKPVVAVYKVELVNPNTGNKELKWVSFVVDLVGKFEFKPHVKARGTYTTKRMGQTVTKYTLEPYSKILDKYKLINDVYVIRADNLYSAFCIFTAMLDYEDSHEGVYDFVSENDMTIMSQVITQTAVNGTKIYGFESLPTINQSLNDMMYDKIISTKVEGNILSHQNRLNNIAKKFETKKNIEPSIQYLASQSAFLKWGFDYVEYDNDIDKSSVQILNHEYDSLINTGILPPVSDFNGLKFVIRFRKLGREHLFGLYSDELKTIVIDKEGSFLHQYALLIDYNYQYMNNKVDNLLTDTKLSNSLPFKAISDKYSEEILKQISATDIQEVTLQRELDTLLIPEEIFAKCLEFYLSNRGVKGVLLGQLDEDNQDSDWYNKFIYNLSFTACNEPNLLKLINDYFGVLLFNITDDQISQYNALQTHEKWDEVATTEDLSTQLGTTNLEYSEMTKEERHICVLAKKFIKNITIKQVEKLVLKTDELYDTGIAFPNQYSLVFKYDSESDKIVDVQIVSELEYPNMKNIGYRTVNTKSMIKTEQSFYELFYAQGVKQQIEIDILIKNIRDMFHNS